MNLQCKKWHARKDLKVQILCKTTKICHTMGNQLLPQSSINYQNVYTIVNVQGYPIVKLVFDQPLLPSLNFHCYHFAFELPSQLCDPYYMQAIKCIKTTYVRVTHIQFFKETHFQITYLQMRKEGLWITLSPFKFTNYAPL